MVDGNSVVPLGVPELLALVARVPMMAIVATFAQGERAVKDAYALDAAGWFVLAAKAAVVFVRSDQETAEPIACVVALNRARPAADDAAALRSLDALAIDLLPHGGGSTIVFLEDCKAWWT